MAENETKDVKVEEAKSEDTKAESTIDEVIEEIKSVDENEQDVADQPKRRRGRPRREAQEDKSADKSEKLPEQQDEPQAEQKAEKKTEKKAEKKKEKSGKTNSFICTKPTAFYASKTHENPKARIIGAVQVLNEDDNWREVIATIKGFGKVQGFIKK